MPDGRDVDDGVELESNNAPREPSPGDLSEADWLEVDREYARAKDDGSLQRACDHRAMVRERNCSFRDRGPWGTA